MEGRTDPSETKMDGVPHRPQARLLKPTDPFFADGDIYCNSHAKYLPAEVEDRALQRTAEIQCHVAGCLLPFSTLADYESHYNGAHRNVCRVCHRVLPSSHLLEIHVLEWHDTLFAVLAAKQPMYQCLVQGCPHKSPDQASRKVHLVTSHCYPGNFHFDRLITTRSVKSHDAGDHVMEVGMNATDEEEDSGKLHHKYRVPKNISFGRGGSRTFQRRPRLCTKEVPEDVSEYMFSYSDCMPSEELNAQDSMVCGTSVEND